MQEAQEKFDSMIYDEEKINIHYPFHRLEACKDGK
jgi:hypothetical protein